MRFFFFGTQWTLDSPSPPTNLDVDTSVETQDESFWGNKLLGKSFPKDELNLNELDISVIY